MISDFSASIISDILRQKGIPMESYEIEMLDFINQKGIPITTQDIATEAKLGEDSVEFIVRSLEIKGLCKHNSPPISMTENGKKLIDICYKYSEQIQKRIDKDSYFNDIAKSSKSIIG